jgi:hypothetical protein
MMFISKETSTTENLRIQPVQTKDQQSGERNFREIFFFPQRKNSNGSRNAELDMYLVGAN